MFDAHCDRCAAVVLLGPRRIIGLQPTDDGIVVTYRCYCGEVGREVTGRRASRASAEPATASATP